MKRDFLVKAVKLDAEAYVVSCIDLEIKRLADVLGSVDEVLPPARQVYEEARLALWQKIRDALPGMVSDPALINGLGVD